PIDSVMAEMTDKAGRGFTTMALSLRFANGAVGSLIGTYDSSYQYMNVGLLEINGSSAHIVIEDTVRRFTYQVKGEEKREVWEASHFNDVDRNYRALLDSHIREALAALRDNRPPPVHASVGRRALLLALDAIQSFETGRKIMTSARPKN